MRETGRLRKRAAWTSGLGRAMVGWHGPVAFNDLQTGISYFVVFDEDLQEGTERLGRSRLLKPGGGRTLKSRLGIEVR
jgi:hypothetical protein